LLDHVSCFSVYQIRKLPVSAVALQLDRDSLVSLRLIERGGGEFAAKAGSDAYSKDQLLGGNK
jgi:hypothetical protein